MKFIYIDKTNNISDLDIMNDVLFVKNTLKKDTITMREYFLYGKYGKKAITNHFGTWNNLLDKINIPKTRSVEHLDKNDIFILIKNLWLKLNRQPTIREFEENTKHTSKIIISNFGKWSNCLKEFVEWANNEKLSLENIITIKQHKTRRAPSASLRNDVMKRDNYRCVICGRSPSSTPGLELHIDHIIPYSLGGETIFSNLQTLCSDCNLGKSNKKD